MDVCASLEVLNSSFTKITQCESASGFGFCQLIQMVFKIYEVRRKIQNTLRELRKQISGDPDCEVYDICACVDRLNSKERAEALSLWGPWNKISNETVETGQKCLQSMAEGITQCKNDGYHLAAWVLSFLTKKYEKILDSLDEIEFITEEYLAALKAKG